MDQPRRYPRTRVNVPVVCEFADGEQSEGLMVDVGVGGYRVECDRAPDPGARVALETRLAGSTRGSPITGVVRWSNAVAFGAEIGLRDATDPKRIAELVSSGILTSIATPTVGTGFSDGALHTGSRNPEHDQYDPAGSAQHP